MLVLGLVLIRLGNLCPELAAVIKDHKFGGLK